MLKQKFAIPTYFGSGPSGNADWLGAANAGELLGMVVFNPASGPGYTLSYRTGGAKHAEYQTRIEQMQAVGAEVLGYVTTNYRDSLPDNTVQREHRFTRDGDGSVTTRNSSGDISETGWTTGFGPVQVRSASTLPDGLAVATDYFWIAVSSISGRFATSLTNAEGGIAIQLTSDGDPGPDHTNHAMGLSRTSANIANVFSEIDQYYVRWPTIDGMFLDEMDNDDDLANITYYRQIFDYVKTKGGKALVVENPGGGFPESMVDVADTFMAFESQSVNYPAHDPAWRMTYPAAKFWHAIHSCPVAEMAAMIEISRTKNAGYIYVTDLLFPDQDVWLHIASNFADEVMEVSKGNAPPLVEVRVPFVRELRPGVAAARIRDVGLDPVFKGMQGPNAWVWRQSPREGRRVPPGSKVILQLRTGPIQ